MHHHPKVVPHVQVVIDGHLVASTRKAAVCLRNARVKEGEVFPAWRGTCSGVAVGALVGLPLLRCTRAIALHSDVGERCTWSLPTEAKRLWCSGLRVLKTTSCMGEQWLSCGTPALPLEFHFMHRADLLHRECEP